MGWKRWPTPLRRLAIAVGHALIVNGPCVILGSTCRANRSGSAMLGVARKDERLDAERLVAASLAIT